MSNLYTESGRRPLTRSLAVNLSPKFVLTDDALKQKKENRLGTSIRRVFSRELSLREAEVIKQEGGELLISPKGQDTNKHYEELKARETRMHLYQEFVGVTWLFCETDLFSLVSDSLDYFVRKVFAENEGNFNVLVPVPFKTRDASHVRYGPLARHVGLGQFGGSKEIGDAATLLLEQAEGALSEAVDHNLQTTRQDLKHYQTSGLKGRRIFGTHVFSSLLKDQYGGPLDATDFSSSLPSIKDESFDFDNDDSLRHMAVRALVLKDLEEKMAKNRLQGGSRVLHEVAFKLIKKLLSINVPYSFKATYGGLSTEVLRHGETENDITNDHIFLLEE